jgi:hypothetical protein
MSNHAIEKPDVQIVRKGEPWSKCVGGEQRYSGGKAPHDGIAIDGHLFTKGEVQKWLDALKVKTR